MSTLPYSIYCMTDHLCTQYSWKHKSPGYCKTMLIYALSRKCLIFPSLWSKTDKEWVWFLKATELCDILKLPSIVCRNHAREYFILSFATIAHCKMRITHFVMTKKTRTYAYFLPSIHRNILMYLLSVLINEMRLKYMLFFVCWPLTNYYWYFCHSAKCFCRFF